MTKYCPILQRAIHSIIRRRIRPKRKALSMEFVCLLLGHPALKCCLYSTFEQTPLMRNVRLLFVVVFFYAAGFGLVGVGTPLACLKLKMTSEQIGFVTAGGPLGYALGCAIFG